MQQVPEEQLFLFDCGPDMQEIRLAADDMKRATRSRETLRAYKYDWQLFERWCESTGRQALPASAETLALFTAAHLKDRKVSSAERRMAAVIFRHRGEGMAVPDRAEARAILSGARRQRQEQPDSKAADRKSVV